MKNCCLLKEEYSDILFVDITKEYINELYEEFESIDLDLCFEQEEKKV